MGSICGWFGPGLGSLWDRSGIGLIGFGLVVKGQTEVDPRSTAAHDPCWVRVDPRSALVDAGYGLPEVA